MKSTLSISVPVVNGLVLHGRKEGKKREFWIWVWALMEYPRELSFVILIALIAALGGDLIDVVDEVCTKVRSVKGR
jgi:hypothetical protein